MIVYLSFVSVILFVCLLFFRLALNFFLLLLLLFLLLFCCFLLFCNVVFLVLGCLKKNNETKQRNQNTEVPHHEDNDEAKQDTNTNTKQFSSCVFVLFDVSVRLNFTSHQSSVCMLFSSICFCFYFLFLMIYCSSTTTTQSKKMKKQQL